MLIQFRRNTNAIWTSLNPILARGEPGFNLDNGKLKIGDGVTRWNDLPYYNADIGSGGTGYMLASAYDALSNGVVNDSRKFAGSLPAYYLNRLNHTGQIGAGNINNVDTATILGRFSPGNGAAEKITLGGGLILATDGVLSVANKADLVGGKIPTSQLPSISIGESFVAATQAEMLALAAQIGDVAIRTDQNDKKYLLLGNAATLSDWVDFSSTGAVTSVNGQTGPVTLGKADIGLGSADDTPDAAKPVSTAQAAAIGQKADDAAVVKLTGNQTINHQKTFTLSPIIPTLPTTDESTKTASTAYVAAKIVASGTFGPQGPAGPAGPQGPAGATGATGAPGSAGAAGPAGNAATVAVGSTTTGGAGSSAAVGNSGTSSGAIFNFTIPAGATGATGAQGLAGPTGATGPQGAPGQQGATGPAGAPPSGMAWANITGRPYLVNRTVYYLSDTSLFPSGLTQAAINNLGTTNPKQLIIDGAATMTESVSIPANIEVLIAESGLVTAGNNRLDIASLAPHSSRKLFAVSAAGGVYLGKNACPEFIIHWWTGAGASAEAALQTTAINNIFANLTENGGGKLFISGKWKTASGITVPRNTEINCINKETSGFQLTTSNTYLLRIQSVAASPYQNIRINNLGLFLETTTGSTGVQITGAQGHSIYNVTLNHLLINVADIGIDVIPMGGDVEVENLNIVMPEFVNCTTQAYRQNTVNGSVRIHLATVIIPASGMGMRVQRCGVLVISDAIIGGGAPLNGFNTPTDGSCFLQTEEDCNLLLVCNSQDENLEYFYRRTTNTNYKNQIVFENNSIQSKMHHAAGGVLHVKGGTMVANVSSNGKTLLGGAYFTDEVSATASVTAWIYCTGVTIDNRYLGNYVNSNLSSSFVGGSYFIERDAQLDNTRLWRRFTDIDIHPDEAPNTLATYLTNFLNTAKPLFRFVVPNTQNPFVQWVSRSGSQYYGFQAYRRTSDGALVWQGNQSGNNNVVFQAGDIINDTVGRGFVVFSTDGTKKGRIHLDNSGSLDVTLL